MLFLILRSCLMYSSMLYSCCRHNTCSCWYKCGILRSSLHHYCEHVHSRTMLMTMDLQKTASPSDSTCDVSGHPIWADTPAALSCCSSNTISFRSCFTCPSLRDFWLSEECHRDLTGFLAEQLPRYSYQEWPNLWHPSLLSAKPQYQRNFF